MGALLSILLALFAFVFGASSPAQRSLPATPVVSFAYDGQYEVGTIYDGSSLAAFTYDSAADIAIGEETIRAFEPSGIFGKAAAFLAAKGGEVLQAPESWTMSYLRNGADVPIPQGTSGIRNMMANITADSGNEVALLRLTDGSRVLRMGGPTSVTLGEDVETVIAHTHPSGNLRFSDADIMALWKRDQLSSVLINPKTGLGKRVSVSGNW